MNTKMRSGFALIIALVVWSVVSQTLLTMAKHSLLLGRESITSTMSSVAITLGLGAGCAFIVHQRILLGKPYLKNPNLAKQLMWSPILFMAGAAPIMFIVVPWLVINRFSWTDELHRPLDLALFFLNITFLAFQEEVLYRVLIMDFVHDITDSKLCAITVQALIFSLTHGGFPLKDYYSFLYYFTPGLILGIIFNVSRNLIAVTALHAGANWCVSSFFGSSRLLGKPLITPQTPGNTSLQLMIFGIILLIQLGTLTRTRK